MPTNDFSDEKPVNDEEKCPCVLVLDTSGSMSGDPIDELNSGLSRFHEEISKNTTASSRLEIEIIRFDGSVEVVQKFSLVENFTMPELTTRATHGSTKMVDGVRKGILRVEERKKWYNEKMQNYSKPYIILVTNSEPEGDQDLDGLSWEIQNGVDGKHFKFMAFGLEEANMEVLQKISHTAFPPSKAKGIDFVKFFEWLSATLASITNSKEGEKVDISPKNDDKIPLDDDENPFTITGQVHFLGRWVPFRRRVFRGGTGRRGCR